MCCKRYPISTIFSPSGESGHSFIFQLRKRRFREWSKPRTTRLHGKPGFPSGFWFYPHPPPAPGIEATTKGEHVKGDGLSLFYFDLVKIYRDIILETFCDPFLLFPIHISPPYSRSPATMRIPCILKKKKKIKRIHDNSLVSKYHVTAVRKWCWVQAVFPGRFTRGTSLPWLWLLWINHHTILQWSHWL